MWKTGFVKEVVLVAIVACLTAQVTANAQEASKEPYCAEGERYYPEGLIGQIGKHYFRICAGEFAYSPLGSRPVLNIDTEQRLDAYAVQNFPDIRESIGRLRDHYGYLKGYLEPVPNLLQYLAEEEVGQIELGGLTYKVFVSSRDLSRLIVPVSKENMPGDFTLVFPGSDTGDIPEHVLTCGPSPTKRDPINAPEKGHHCRLYVRYTPSESLYIVIPIIHIPTEKPTSFINTRPFDFDRLPFFAQQLRDAYRYIEVTDQLDELKDIPIIRMPVE